MVTIMKTLTLLLIMVAAGFGQCQKQYLEDTGYFLDVANNQAYDSACKPAEIEPGVPAKYELTYVADFRNLFRFFPNDPVRLPIQLRPWFNPTLTTARAVVELLNRRLPWVRADVYEIVMTCGTEPCYTVPIRTVRLFSNIPNPYIHGGKGYLLFAGECTNVLMRDRYQGWRVIERDVELAWSVVSSLR